MVQVSRAADTLAEAPGGDMLGSSTPAPSASSSTHPEPEADKILDTSVWQSVLVAVCGLDLFKYIVIVIDISIVIVFFILQYTCLARLSGFYIQ